MCGIVGWASRRPIGERKALALGRDAMAHRGPDAAGEWWSPDGRVGFGHRRLSILDLTPVGGQPMAGKGGGTVIVFNGEIYNHQDLRVELESKGRVFRSRSDTEVILEAYAEWGLECPSRLNGAFAFALFDRDRKRLFFCRDRAGEKPFFYAHNGGMFRFASELKALMADPAWPRRVDPEALDCYLSIGYVPGARCILEGVNKLPAAHAMTFDVESGDSKIWRYWAPPESEESGRADIEELTDELAVLLEDSVRRQLVADVPVGVLLSGGVDSSLVAAMACRSAARVKTFTVRFPGHEEFDETPHARLIASRFATEHVEVQADDCAPSLLPMLARQFDEPIVDSSMVPTYLVSRTVRRHCTVALGGDGGDELFGGYAHYDRLLRLRGLAGAVPAMLRVPAGVAAERFLPLGFKGRNWIQALSGDLEEGLPLIASYFGPTARSRMMSSAGFLPLNAERLREARVPRRGDLLQRATRMDFSDYLPEDILTKVDRASMLNSLEVRAPFLDHRLVEFAFKKVPSALKATPSERKILLKRLCSRLLPPEFDLHRKQGFSIPLGRWLRIGRWRESFQEILLDSGPSPFRREFVEDLLDGQARGRSNSERLFALAMFELWRREYHVQVG